MGEVGDGNVTAVAGRRNRSHVLYFVLAAGLFMSVAATWRRSTCVSFLAFTPTLVLNMRGTKPKTLPQFIGVLILWSTWSAFGAAVITIISFGCIPFVWGSLFPCLTVLTVVKRKRQEIADYAAQHWVIKYLWDPPFMLSIWLCDQLGITLLHDGNGQYLSVCDDQICISAVPFAGRVHELEAAKVGSVVNMCAEYSGPQAAYRRCGIEQLWLPTTDTTSPSVEDLKRGVAFIRRRLVEQPGRRVLIHCKGGRGRAATMAVAWYVSNGLAIDEAVRLLSSKRPVTEKVVATYGPLREFASTFASSH